MEKKSNPTARKEINEKEESNYEKLRDELFDYRVTIKTYIKNLNWSSPLLIGQSL
ncbi:MAG: hypothetical protein RBR97_19750 [Bacteroidales bacterium]|nr:hypothetical protein [Bacteroidales bacterium]